MKKDGLLQKFIWLTIFSISMAFIESAVVVYLRRIYYPGGFAFPLSTPADMLLGVEVLREMATMFMLLSISMLSGRKLWERFAYFLFCFGIWDIFYYIWLKVLLNWPSSIFEWDILFLIPLPWIGPVIAPVSLSLFMIICGTLIIHSYEQGYDFKPVIMTKILVLAGTGLILFSFLHDTEAALHQKLPQPYLYTLLFLGEMLYIMAFIISYRKTRTSNQHE
jgi:hypothetical protein